MHLELDHAHHYDWALRHESEVRDDDVHRPSPHGEQFRHVRELIEEPATTTVHIPDASVDRMVADHREAVETARRGYVAIRVGGERDGQEVAVAPRDVPLRSLNRLVADHLETFIYGHTPGDQITAVRILDSALEPDEAALLERYLVRRFVEGDA